jgi:hypothetical protein
LHSSEEEADKDILQMILDKEDDETPSAEGPSGASGAHNEGEDYDKDLLESILQREDDDDKSPAEDLKTATLKSNDTTPSSDNKTSLSTVAPVVVPSSKPVEVPQLQLQSQTQTPTQLVTPKEAKAIPSPPPKEVARATETEVMGKKSGKAAPKVEVEVPKAKMKEKERRVVKEQKYDPLVVMERYETRTKFADNPPLVLNIEDHIAHTELKISRMKYKISGNIGMAFSRPDSERTMGLPTCIAVRLEFIG